MASQREQPQQEKDEHALCPGLAGFPARDGQLGSSWVGHLEVGMPWVGPGLVGFPARDGQLGSFLVPGLSGSQLEETRGRHPRRDHTRPLAMTNLGQLLGWNQARWISFMWKLSSESERSPS
jgi:hypothetical protein